MLKKPVFGKIMSKSGSMKNANNMFGRHIIINVKYSRNQKGMKYFCDLNIFEFINNYF